MAIRPQQLNATIRGVKSVDEVIDFIQLWDYDKEPLRVKLFGAGSTLDYKAVFWIWMRSITAQYVQRKMPDYQVLDKEGQRMHLIFCKRHLGVVPAFKVSKTQFSEAVRTITYPEDLNKGQWFDFMRRIEEDCMAMGITLPENDNNEYAQDKLRQVA